MKNICLYVIVSTMKDPEEATQGSFLSAEFSYPTADPASSPVEEYSITPDGQFQAESEPHQSEVLPHEERVTLLEDEMVRSMGQARKRQGFVSESPEAVRAQRQSAAERGISRQSAIGQAAVNANEFEARARQLYEEWFELKSAEIPEEVDPRDYVPTFYELEHQYFDAKNSRKSRDKLYREADRIKQSHQLAS